MSPCDGRVLHWGRVEAESRVEQVKGVSYRLDTFLGHQPLADPVTSATVVTPRETGDSEGTSPVLYQCVLYLAPGDYHGFHSPTDWSLTARRHFPGELLSVSPAVVR